MIGDLIFWFFLNLLIGVPCYFVIIYFHVRRKLKEETQNRKRFENYQDKHFPDLIAWRRREGMPPYGYED